MTALRRWITLWSPVVAWCGVIFYLSHIPHLRILEGPWDFILRKMAHMVEYGVLARLLVRAFVGSTFWSWKRIFIWSLAFSVLYACTDEYHQTFVPGRVGSFYDVTLDSIGAWLALGLKP